MEDQSPVMGRPRKEIDWHLLESLATCYANLNYCAERQVIKWGEEANHQTIKACREVIERRIKERYDVTFTEYRTQRLEPVKVKLFQKQLDVAFSGNPKLLQWMGIQLLNQKAKQEISTEDAKPITIAYLPLSKREAS